MIRDYEDSDAVATRHSFVAEVGGEVAGFSDVSPEGYIDMMFVAPKFQRRGIAGRLLEYAEARAREQGAALLTANVSITARKFFERHGFTVEAEQHLGIGGAQLTNFRMRKTL